MIKRNALIIAMFALAATAEANILYLTNGDGLGGYSFAEEANQVAYLQSRGLDVNVEFYSGTGTAYSGALTPEQITTLNGYDVIYMSRDLSTNDYRGNGASWNQVAAPMINSTIFMIRNDTGRMQWTDTGSTNLDQVGDFTFVVNDTASPFFNNITFSGAGNNEFVAFSSADMARLALANGTATGEIASSSGNTALALYPAGVALPGGGGTPSGDRLFLGWLNFSSAGGIEAQWADVTADGQELLYNAMIEMGATAIPEPSTYVLIAGGLALAFVAIRRRR